MTTTKNPSTNSKEVKVKIQAHVIECLSTDEFPKHDGTLKTSLEIVCEEFQSAACYENNIKRLKTWQSVFIDWLLGAPSCFNIEFYNSEILEKMASFGLPLPENKDTTDGIDLYRNLIFREFMTICKKNNIDFWSYCTTKN